MLVELADVAELVAPVQSIGEAVGILSFSMGKSEPQISATLNKWNVLFDTVPTTISILANALQFARQHRFQHWDSLIVCTAIEADCSILLSEHMQDGFVWRGLTVINPFAATVHPLLASLLEP
jgi:predicted nucleic acid-binding protein